jgi:hypothetical protein
MSSSYLIFAGVTYYPTGGYKDIYGFADTKEDAMNIYYEALITGLHNCDYFNQTWWNQSREVVGNNWAHILCVNTRQIVKETLYEEREEYTTVENLRGNFKEKIKQFKTLSKKEYISQYSQLEYDILYNMFMGHYLSKGLSKKQIRKKLWWMRFCK